MKSCYIWTEVTYYEITFLKPCRIEYHNLSSTEELWYVCQNSILRLLKNINDKDTLQ